jgi:hypothetical protein
MTDARTTHPEAAALWDRQAAGETIDQAELHAAIQLGSDRAATAAVAPTPPTAPVTATTDAPVNERAAAAFAAQTAAQARQNLVEAAKELIQQELGVDPEGLSDSEILSISGIEKTPAQLRDEEEAAIQADPVRLADWQRTRDLKTLDSQWWQMARSQQKAETARLGIDWDAARAAKLKEMRAATPDAKPAESDQS